MKSLINEFISVLESPSPLNGILEMDKSGKLEKILPELTALKSKEKGHKDNFAHSLAVLDNLSKESSDLYLRLSALLHDIGKAKTKKFENGIWTFANHENVGSKMIPVIFKRLHLDLVKLVYVQQMVSLHMRPAQLLEDTTDSAKRRLITDANGFIKDLFLLCSADITTKNETKKNSIIDSYRLLFCELMTIQEKDRIRNFKTIDGNKIISIIGKDNLKYVGIIKNRIKDAVLDGITKDEDSYLKSLLVEMSL